MQEYFEGDIVEVVDLPPSKSHFKKGKGVIGNINHNSSQAGNTYEWNYSIRFLDTMFTSCWYQNSNLKLIEGGPMRRYITQTKVDKPVNNQ